jgi:hypothetical protein
VRTRVAEELRQVRFICAQEYFDGCDEISEPSCCSFQLRTGPGGATSGRGLKPAEHAPQSLAVVRDGDGEYDSAAEKVE